MRVFVERACVVWWPGRVCRNNSKALTAATKYLRKKSKPEKQEVVVPPV
jgi:hypothetical protein